MIEIMGYTAVSLNLISMTMKNVIYLRLFSLISNAVCIVYGVLLSALPLIVGCGIAVIIHTCFLNKLFLNQRLNKNENQNNSNH